MSAVSRALASSYHSGSAVGSAAPKMDVELEYVHYNQATLLLLQTFISTCQALHPCRPTSLEIDNALETTWMHTHWSHSKLKRGRVVLDP